MSFNTWSTIIKSLNSYAVTYSFGAFLARNFGGSALFRNIVQNSSGDYTAVDSGLSATGFPGTPFSSALKKWGVATLLSHNADISEVPPGYRFNTGGFTTSTIGSISMVGHEPFIYINIKDKGGVEYRVVGPLAEKLVKDFQGKTITLEGVMVKKAIGPGFPAEFSAARMVD